MAPIHVAAGILRDTRGRILISERMGDSPFAGLWEFPGGKIDSGESPSDALRRELAEELGICIEDYRHLMSVKHQYDDRIVLLDFYLVSGWQGKPAGREGQGLRWQRLDAMDAEQLLPADAPVLETLKSMSWPD